jgi:8-amino-7-oxononanoate synthase
VTESVFSADGDLTDLPALVDLADRHGAAVVVDEAHATGLYGARRSGRVEEAGLTDRVLATLHTGGKALGAAGAWVAGEKALVEHLVNHARSFVFSTAPMPALAAALVASLDRLARDADGPASVHRKAARLRARLSAAGLDLGRSSGAILPVPVGDPRRTVALREALREDGFDVGALRPPTVPEGTARLRVAVRAPIADADLDRFAERLLRRLEEVR